MSDNINDIQFFRLEDIELGVKKKYIVQSEKLDKRYIKNDISFNPIIGIVSHFGLNAPLIDIRFEYDLDPIVYSDNTEVLIINYKGTVLGIIADTISDKPMSDIYKTIDISEIIKNDPYLLQDGFEEEEAIRAIEGAIKISEDHHLTNYDEEKISLNVIDNSAINNDEILDIMPLEININEISAKYDFSKLYIGELLEEALVREISISKDMNRDDIIKALENSIF